MKVIQAHINLKEGTIEGELHIPPDALGVVLFAHGSGSSRFSPRNQAVAKELRKNKLATLLIDLLTAEEDLIDQQTRALRFDIKLLSERLLKVTEWISKESSTHDMKIGYFGSSTGAAAALIAAAHLGKKVSAVVSRGGRPDLAEPVLSKVVAPTLLIVGGYDDVVIELNEEAFLQLTCTKELVIVPKATHLFEEPGALEQVSALAARWFVRYFSQEMMR